MTEAETIAADPKFETRAELIQWVAEQMIAGTRLIMSEVTAMEFIELAWTIIRVTLAHKDLNDGQD